MDAQTAISSLTVKGRATMKAIGDRKLSFFDDGIVEGSGIWGGCLVSEMGHKSAGVISNLEKQGLLISTDYEEGDDGKWWELTELGAQVANALAD